MAQAESAGGRRYERFRPPLGWTRPDILLASIGVNITSLGLPVVILQVYDRIIPGYALETFTVMLVGLCGLVLTEAILRTARSSLVAWVGARFEHRASMVMFDRMMGADQVAYERDTAGVYMTRMAGMDSLREFYAGQAAMAIVDLPFVVVFIALIYFIAGDLVILPLVLLVLFSLTAIWLGGRLGSAVMARSTTDDRRYSFLMEVLGGIHTVKSMAMEPQMLRRYERLQQTSAESVARLSRLNGIALNMANSFSQIGMAVLVAMGAPYVIDGTLSLGALAATTLLTGRALQPVLRAMGLWNQMQSVRQARHRIDEIYALPPEPRSGKDLRPTILGHVTFENVTFSYRTDDEPTLRAVSLEIREGEAIGITGANGVGKSTLMYLVMGLLRPSEGRILLDGFDLMDIDPLYLRQNIAFLAQTGVIFRGTLLENLTMFRDDETVDQAVLIARALGLDDVITKLPRGLDTRLGEGAVEIIPDGVRQRIDMARSLTGTPKMVLFDDANQTLDFESDRALRLVLERYHSNHTMIMVSHRPSLLGLCDRIYHLADGQVREVETAGRGPIRPQVSTERLALRVGQRASVIDVDPVTE